jgi:DnaJ family protein B protein 4
MPGMQGRSTSLPRNMGRSSGQPATKPPPIQHNLNVTLEDLYTGCTKRMRITAKKYDAASGKVVSIATDKEIQVKAGWKDGTKITFEGEGDELGPGSIPADVVFVVKAKPHDRFTREGDDLHYEVCSL